MDSKRGSILSNRLLRLAHSTFVAGLLVGCAEGPPENSQAQVGAPPSISGSPDASYVGAVRLTDQQAQDLSIQTMVVSREPVTLALRVSGRVNPAPDYYAEVSSPLSGLIANMFAHEGERVSRGQVVAELESLELANLVSNYWEEEAERQFAELQVERYERLVERRISPAASLEEARANLSRALARSGAAVVRLRSLRVTDQDLARWYDAPDTERPVLAIRSPIDGVIGDHLIELGQSVTAYQKMMSIVNTARVLVKGYFSPEDASWIRAGDAVEVTLPALPGRPHEASLTSIGPSLDGGSRAVTANILVDSDGQLIPGQDVRVTVRVRPDEPLIALPLSAIEFEGETAMVFVQGQDGQSWYPRPIEIARLGADQAIVSMGIEPGQIVATTQVFTLKALARFAEYGEEP